MSEQTGKDESDPKSTTALVGEEPENSGNTLVEEKGKGKSLEPTPEDVSMDDAESSSEEEADEADEAQEAGDLAANDSEDEDNLVEIDPGNIIPSGRRTRGRNIDFAKAAEEMGPEDDEDEEDDDFETAEDEEMKD